MSREFDTSLAISEVYKDITVSPVSFAIIKPVTDTYSGNLTARALQRIDVTNNVALGTNVNFADSSPIVWGSPTAPVDSLSTTANTVYVSPSTASGLYPRTLQVSAFNGDAVRAVTARLFIRPQYGVAFGNINANNSDLVYRSSYSYGSTSSNISRSFTIYNIGTDSVTAWFSVTLAGTTGIYYSHTNNSSSNTVTLRTGYTATVSITHNRSVKGTCTITLTPNITNSGSGYLKLVGSAVITATIV